MYNKLQLVEEMKELLSAIPKLKSRGVGFVFTPQFEDWKDEKVKKCLRAGEPYTTDQLKRFEGLYFRSRSYIPSHLEWADPEEQARRDRKAYETDMENTESILKSAIQNLERALDPPPKRRIGFSKD